MGFFSKKKNSESPSSVLSESEIQKKLYGEFADGATHVVTGERDSFRESAPFSLPPQESAPEKEAAPDLFSSQNAALIEPDLPPRRIIPETKSVDLGPRYVPLHDFEKRTAPQDQVSSEADPYARFRQTTSPQDRLNALLNPWKDFSGKGAELFRLFLDPKQVAVRRVIYWILALLVVFFLFWGVNVLNSQREDAMRTRYKIAGETAPVKAPAPEASGVPSDPSAERPVVITPAPVRPPKARIADSSQTASGQAGGTYVIQVVTYPTRKDADQIVDVFKRAGLRAFVKEDTRPSGRVFYLVLIGGFRTAADAQAQLSKFRGLEAARPFQDAFVKTNRS